MPTPVYSNPATNILCQLLAARLLTSPNALLFLFKNQLTVTGTTTLNDLLRCDFSGYADVTVASFLPPYLAPIGGSAIQIPTQQFNYYNPQSVTGTSGLTGGTGYTSPPTVSFVGGGGSGATATATVAAGAVTAVTITNGGSGYTSVPTVVFTGGAGTGAAATAVIGDTGQGVTGVAVNTGGTGYTTPPTVAITGGGGSGAVVTAQISGGVVTGFTVVNAGTGYTSVPSVGLSGGGGSGAAGTATIGHVNNNVFGFGLTDPVTGVLFFAGNFDQPIPMIQPFDAIPLDVIFNFGN